MRKLSHVLWLTGFICLLLLALSTYVLAGHEKVTVMNNLTSMPLAFTENRGQWPDDVLFRANSGGAMMWFTRGGAVYQFTRSIPANKSQDAPPFAVGSERFDHEPDSIETSTIKATFVGANPDPQIVGWDKMEYKCNYFIGNDPDKWHTDVTNYKSITYKNIYDGIDLKYYGNGKQMEYDFIVAPGVDPSQICIQYDDAKSVSVNGNGELVVETDWGQVIERKPLVYQSSKNYTQRINCEYVLIDENRFGFYLLDGYDSEMVLVIDPVLSYSTYLGGNDWDNSFGITVDEFNNVYVIGVTYSSDFPRENPYQASISVDNDDAFVTKLNSSGNGLIYSTFLGGNHSDCGRDIVVDSIGAAYITGFTHSDNFPTANPYDASHNNPHGYDAFVAKLSPAGNELIYSTYLGGVGTDNGYSGGGIAIDGDGCAYVTGETSSYNFPTQNAYDNTLSGRDAFVTKLSAPGNTLIYSTFLGGNDVDMGDGIKVDNDGCAYVTGRTLSTNFDTLNPFQESLGEEGHYDAFVTKLSTAGNSLIFSTYLGGENDDMGCGIDIDSHNYTYITGFTKSDSFPILNPYNGVHNGSEPDAFITKLGLDGDTLVYSTYIGGGYVDYSRCIDVDHNNCVYIAGETYSSDFPTVCPFVMNLPGSDAFVTKLNSAGNDIIYSTYFGGSGDDYCYGITVDESNSVYITSWTNSNDFPLENAFDSILGGDRDIYVAKISEAYDTDCDWVCDTADNCPFDFNPDQIDTDGDGNGDSCDICPGYDDYIDTDEDGWPDGCDNCPNDFNPNQIDTDSDSVGDSCDNCVNVYNPIQEDIDADSVGDSCDNCIDVYNPDQSDSDGDEIGDACDCDCEPGSVNLDGTINIFDITYLISYLYLDGPAPQPYELCSGDMNGDCIVNIFDITGLIAYLYLDGSRPRTCEEWVTDCGLPLRK